MSQTPQNIQNEGVRENDFDLKTTLVNTDRIRLTTANDNYNMTWAVFKDVSGWNAREQRIQQLEQQVDELIELGGIEESGSNSNGRYIKFSDGTMICVRYEDINSNDFAERNADVSGIGELKRSRISSQTYPAFFEECYYSEFGIHSATDASLRGNIIGTKMRYGSDTLGVVNTMWSTPAFFHNLNIPDDAIGTFAFFAIGRWK